jgi:predicted glutamine amidotransferase
MRELLNEAFLQAHIGERLEVNGPAKDGYGIYTRRGRRSRHRARTYKTASSYLVDPNHDCVLNKIGGADLVLCHIRLHKEFLANPEIKNTHPFIWRDFAFVHNGVLYEFKENRAAILRQMGEKWRAKIRGETDTEHLFYLWLSFLDGVEGVGAGAAAAAASLKKMVAFLKSLGCSASLNFIIVARDYWIASRIVLKSKKTPELLPLYILRGGCAAAAGDKVLISTNKLIPHQKMIGKNKIVYGNFGGRAGRGKDI